MIIIVVFFPFIAGLLLKFLMNIIIIEFTSIGKCLSYIVLARNLLFVLAISLQLLTSLYISVHYVNTRCHSLRAADFTLTRRSCDRLMRTLVSALQTSFDSVPDNATRFYLPCVCSSFAKTHYVIWFLRENYKRILFSLYFLNALMLVRIILYTRSRCYYFFYAIYLPILLYYNTLNRSVRNKSRFKNA